MYYDNNLKSLFGNLDMLYSKIQEVTYNYDNCSVGVDIAKTGEIILKTTVEGKEIYLNSRYNPSREAEKLMEEYVSMPEASILMMYGFANGAFAREFLSKNKSKCKMIIFEPCIDVFMRTMHEIDLSDILSDRRVAICVSGINEEMFAYLLLRNIGKENIKTNKVVDIPAYRQVYTKGYTTFIDVIKDKINNAFMDINTVALFGERMAYTSIQNMRYLYGCRSACDYEHVFPDELPVIIVSPGPSLVKNIELLREAKGKALIVAVDTAIKAVITRGIIPDIIMTVDSHKSLKKFNFDGLEDVFFLIDMFASTDVLDKVKPKNIIIDSSDSLVWDKLFKSQGSSMWTVDTGGSVSVDAITSMLALGFKKIILIGQDLAFTGNITYSDNKALTNEQMTGNNAYVKIKDINGNDIYTRKDYQSFVRYIEDIGLRVKDKAEIIDATEGGAFKNNTTIMTLRDAIDRYCNKTYDIRGILESVPRLFVGENAAQIEKTLHDMKNNLRNIGKKMSQAAADCNRAGIMMRSGYYDVKELKRINTSIGKLDESYAKMDENSLIQGFVSTDEFEFASTVHISEEDSIQDSVRLYKNTENYYRSISEAIPRMIGIIDNCLEKINNK